MEKATENNCREQLWRAAGELRERFDGTEGGFAGLTPEQEDGALLFLLEYARRSGDDWSGAMAEAVLERRGRTGGPLRAWACLEAYAQSGRPGRRAAACGFLDRALEERRLPGGGFTGAGNGAELVWNAQMIAALAKAYRVLGESSYLRAAEETRFFLKARLTQPGGRLWRRWQEGTPSGEGRLEDYGFACWALTELYGADFSVSCLREASALADRMTELFRDPRGGLYGLESGEGGAAAGLALACVGRLTGLERHRDAAWEQLTWLADGEEPEGLALLGLTEELWPRRTLVCTCAGAVPAFLALVGEEYRMMALAKTRGNSRSLENAAPWLRMFPVPESGTRLYLCRDGVCEAAADDLLQLYRRLPSEHTAQTVGSV